MKDQKIEQETNLLAEILPNTCIALVIFFLVNAFNSMSRHELFLLKDQDWKITTIPIEAPYTYEIYKIKQNYSIKMFQYEIEIASQDCKYPFLSVCKSEFTSAKTNIKEIKFYESFDPKLNHHSFGNLRIQSLTYVNADNIEQNLTISNSPPNTKKAIKKQRFYLSFNIFLSIWVLIFLSYLASLLVMIPKWMRSSIYIILCLDGCFIVISSLWILIR